MGIKKTTKSMVEICNEIIEKEEEIINSGQSTNSKNNLKLSEEIIALTAELKQFSYNEERAEEIVKKVIENSKKELIRLIKEESGFTEKHEQAEKLMERITLFGGYLPISKEVFGHHKKKVTRLRNLLTEEGNIASAMEKTSLYLKSLIRKLRI